MPKNNKSENSNRASTPYIVGVGASAGGLEALENFFSGCPKNTGLAFVVIQHLSPDYKSMMGDLLSRYTQMPIHIVEQGMQIKPNNVYLIPSGHLMKLVNNCFELTQKTPHVLTLPVDIFFKSLAINSKEKAIGVVLSGTGSDGTRGAYSINESGGLLLAQEPQTSKFNGMPNSVIATGLVDDILPAEKLVERIISHTENPSLKSVSTRVLADAERPDDHDSALEMIFELLLQTSGVNFEDYKMATVSRRIERRMQVKHLPAIEDYAQLLSQDKAELANLRRELFIPVTRFFRDIEAFADLSKLAIEEIIDDTNIGETIRVWCAGVSSGEEVYSIAILFMEGFDKRKRWPNLKIFATDANPLILEVAAAGQYPESIAAEVTPERLERFFTKNNGLFTVKPELRQSIVFAKHNLITDPPFTKMDLVSCRNTLIYFKADAQSQAIHRLQYATKTNRFLFLGSSESLLSNDNAFKVLNQKSRLFKRHANTLPFSIDAQHSQNGVYAVGRERTNLPNNRINQDLSSLDSATQDLVQSYAPPAILVNEQHQAIHLFGNVQPYFNLRDGAVNMEITKILPENLVSVVSALLYKAVKEGIVLYSNYLQVKLSDGQNQLVRVCIRPILNDNVERLALIAFEKAEKQHDSLAPAVDIDQEINTRIESLQSELAATRESLQATIEELETSNEELQATNEELMASNEELQSSNEELQSVNEEINTVNAEFQEKVMHLNQANADLETMGKAVGVATIFVDNALKITRFTPDAVDIFKLIDSDIGRPLSDIRHTLQEAKIIDLFTKTLNTGRACETEVRGENGRTYLLRILSYQAPNSIKPGAVATFTDVSAIQDKDRLQAILDALPEHIAVLSKDGTIRMVNESWKRFARANGDPDLIHSGIGSNYLTACNINASNKETTQTQSYFGVKGVLEGSLPSFSLLYPCHSPTEKRWFVLNSAPILGHFEYGVVVSHSNISAWYHDDSEPAIEEVVSDE